MAVLERWLPNTVTILDRFHCTITFKPPIYTKHTKRNHNYRELIQKYCNRKDIHAAH